MLWSGYITTPKVLGTCTFVIYQEFLYMQIPRVIAAGSENNQINVLRRQEPFSVAFVPYSIDLISPVLDKEPKTKDI
jgi:hypothetical protein